MKLTSILIFIVLITLSAACKKSNNAPVEGKWQEVKMRYYNQDINTGAISGDTTYQANTFGSYDYAQFNNNGTCVLSESALMNNSLQVLNTVQYKQNFTYAKAGSGFALTPVPTDPPIISGIGTTYTVSGVSANRLTLHTVSSYLNPSVPYKTISDSYYTK